MAGPGKPGRPRKAVKSEAAQARPQAPVAAQTHEAGAEDLPQRPNRKRFGQMNYKLAVDPIPGHVQRWFNDIPGRIAHAEDCGYTKVTDDKSKPIYRTVGVSPQGGELRAYLMKIPQQWYDEDQADKQAELDQIDYDIQYGAVGDVKPGHDGRYVPTRPDGRSRIEVTTSVGRSKS